MSGGESLRKEEEYAKEAKEEGRRKRNGKRERETQRKTRKRSETKTGLNVGGITRGLELDAGEGKGGRGEGIGDRG